MSGDLVFIDVETTGLDPRVHQVWEIATARETGPVKVVQVAHTLEGASPEALQINRYYERARVIPPLESAAVETVLRQELEGNYLVASNPIFDSSFLNARWHHKPWHHRKINVADLAMQEFGWDRPQGLAAVALALRERGYPIDDPDHSAGTDVEVLRACYQALRQERVRRG